MSTATCTPSPSATRRILSWLWNPFVTTAGGTALAAGLAILLATSAIGSISNTHFDGVLDTHTGRPASLWFFLAEGIASWLSLAVVLWVAGLVITPRGQRFRAIDLFGTQALARWPFLFVALVCLLPGYTRYTEAMIKSLESIQQGRFQFPQAPFLDMLTFWGVVGVMLICLVWFVALAWQSFRISCDAKGGLAIVTFIIGMLIAEVVSKVVIILGMGLI